MLILGLGSNLSSSFGDRFKNINLAISYLELYEIKLIKQSSFYESWSYPNKENPKFINIVVQASTYLEPVDIASAVIFIEENTNKINSNGKCNKLRKDLFTLKKILHNLF